MDLKKCPDCGGWASYNYYFAAHMCPNCGWEAASPEQEERKLREAVLTGRIPWRAVEEALQEVLRRRREAAPGRRRPEPQC